MEALIEHFEDRRIFEDKFPNPQAESAEDELRSITVGAICETEVCLKLFGTVYGGHGIEDLKSWWVQHRQLPMEEIVRQAQEADRQDKKRRR